MKRSRWMVVPVAAAAVMLALSQGSGSPGSAAPPATSSGVTIVELPGLGGSSAANDISPGGAYVTGSAVKDGLTRAVLWHAGKVVELETPAGVQTEGFAVNDSGTVAGWWSGCKESSCQEQAAVWTADGHLVDTVMDAHGLYVSPDGLTTAGWSSAGAAVWSSAGVWTSSAGSEIYDINAGGVAVGHGPGPGGGPSVPLSWTLPSTQPTPLALPAGATYGVAFAIDASGTAVGMAGNYAVAWSGGQVSVLPTGRTKAFGRAEDVSGGVIVGTVGNRAARWTGRTYVDLNTVLPRRSGWALSAARGLATDGSVVGVGLKGNVERGYLLRPAS